MADQRLTPVPGETRIRDEEPATIVTRPSLELQTALGPVTTFERNCRQESR